jgi:hypothetical protein
VTASQVLAGPQPLEETSAAKDGMPPTQIDHTLNERQQVAILGDAISIFHLKRRLDAKDATGAREYKEYDLHVQHSP